MRSRAAGAGTEKAPAGSGIWVSFTILADILHAAGRKPVRDEEMIVLRGLKYFILAGCLVLLPAGARAETVSVVLDHASILRLPDGVATIVIGNPSIADATMQGNGLLVVTGKGYGVTNLMALDNRGAVIVEHNISVSAPRTGLMTVYRGADRETLSCAPHCQRALVPGDAETVFQSVASQNGTRNGLAVGAQAPR